MIDYTSFWNKNRKNRNKVSEDTILKVSFKSDNCDLKLGGTVTINALLQAVSQGSVYITNPSKLANWSGFKSSAERKVVKKIESNYPFEVYERTPKQVILKVLAKDSLTVAKYPYVSAEWDYITVTRGTEHILTVIKQNGSKFDFHWGERGYTLISDGLQELKKAVIAFLEQDQHILLGWDDGKVDEASICYNRNFGAWQLSLTGYRDGRRICTYVRDEKSKSIDDMKEFVKPYVKARTWEYGKAQTGIDIWRAKLR